MDWQNARNRWLVGEINDREDKENVIEWIAGDPVWQQADRVDFSRPRGSHEGFIYIKGFSKRLPHWEFDTLAISTSRDRWIPKWIVGELVKAYAELKALSGQTEEPN